MKTPEEIARDIVGGCVFPEAPCTSKGRHPSLCTRCGIAPGVAAAIREAEIRGVNAGIVAAAGILSAPHRCVSGSEFECCIDEKAVAIRDLDPAAISAERSAGLSDGGKDRKATPKLSDAPKPAPACARCGGSGEIVAHASAVRNPGGGIERIVRRFEPCPECRGTP